MDADISVNASGVSPDGLGKARRASGEAIAESQRRYADLIRLTARACCVPYAAARINDEPALWSTGQWMLADDQIPTFAPLSTATHDAEGIADVPECPGDPKLRSFRGEAIRSITGCRLRSTSNEVVLTVYRKEPGPIGEEHRTNLKLFARELLRQADANSQFLALALLSEREHTAGKAASEQDPAWQAKGLFQNTFEQAPIGIAYIDRDARFLRSNSAFNLLLKFGIDELSGQSSLDITHGNDVSLVSHELDRLWRGELGSLDIEKRYLRKDGTALWVRATTALVRDDDDGIVCAVELLRDISRRKEMAAALMQQQTLLEAVITDVPIALVACDTEGRVTHYNRAAVDLHGLQALDASKNKTSSTQVRTSATYLADGITPLSAEDRPLARALRGETISKMELVVVSPDAPPRTTLSSARRLLAPDGQLLGAVAVIEDTTERRQSELELERVNKELMTASRQAGMAEVATNVLHNVGNILNSVNISASLVAERIKQSKGPAVARLAALLQERSSDLEEFMTSDPRGRAIPQYLSTLSAQFETDQQITLRELSGLRENIEHIKETVSMQQSYAKLCGLTETVSVVDLVEDSLRLNAGAFARHGVTLQREFNEVPPITVDKHKVLQILVNLVRNAKYACDESGRSDKLLTLRIEPAPAGVRILVIDNGVGIPPENMGRLFSHGFTTRQSGHGFGLHSGALAAQDLGGSLTAKSEGPGSGASFVLELPLRPRESHA